MSEDEEIILEDLDDEDLVAQMHDDLYDGLAEEIDEGGRGVSNHEAGRRY